MADRILTVLAMDGTTVLGTELALASPALSEKRKRSDVKQLSELAGRFPGAYYGTIQEEGGRCFWFLVEGGGKPEWIGFGPFIMRTLH
jgi:hypothetical protein